MSSGFFSVLMNLKRCVFVMSFSHAFKSWRCCVCSCKFCFGLHEILVCLAWFLSLFFWTKPDILEEGEKQSAVCNCVCLVPLFYTLLTHGWLIYWQVMLTFLCVEDSYYYCNIWWFNYPLTIKILRNHFQSQEISNICDILYLSFPNANFFLLDKGFLYVK